MRAAVSRGLAFPAFSLLCWWLAIRHLSSEWTLNEQYHYGWFVPILMIYLIRIRLESPPAVGASMGRIGWLGLMLPAVGLVEAMLLPVQEANPDWRLMGWVLSALAATVTLGVFHLAGGWRWTRHFLFPVLFFFTAVPWPRPIENAVMHDLMQRQAQIGAELLNWWGVMAEARGNVIALSNGVIGVDEACSGIRSLQTALMVALFVGEVFALGWARRTLFLLAGAVWALLLNTARTMILASVAGREGAAGVERWHDTVGHAALGLCLAGLVALGWLWRARVAVRPGEMRARTSLSTVAPRLGMAAGSALVGLLAIGGGWMGTQWWFDRHERSLGPAVAWTFESPSGQPQFDTIELSSRLRAELRYDAASACRWIDSEGRSWVAQYFRWDPGRDSVRTVAVHDPRACLAATGKQLVQVLPAVAFSKGDVSLFFDAYWFKDAGHDVFVYNCVAEDSRREAEETGIPLSQTMSARIEAVMAGRRNMGLRRLEIAVWNARSPGEADALLAELLRSQIREIR